LRPQEKKEQDPPAKQAQGGFAFPDDASGKELAKKLPATGPDKPAALPVQKPLPRMVPPAVKNPAPALTPAGVSIPKLPPEAGAAALKPAAVAEELPLSGYAGNPGLPALEILEVGLAVSVPSPDVNKPPVLFQVTQPTPDATAPSDPTQEASHQAALSGAPSPRSEAAPFLRLSLPDPFVNRRVSDLDETPPEDATPITVTPVVPGP
jgi:hypothetical protein